MISYSELKNYRVNQGNVADLKKFIKRAKAGEPLTVGFIGGSITQGFASSREEKCYAHRNFNYMKKKFRNEHIKYVNAGIGATDSEFACARVDEDLLSYEPDLVVVEFSVNDESNEHYMETYECLIRKILSAKKRPAVILLHSVCYDCGKNAELIHLKIARHYDLPAVSMRTSVYELLLNGLHENSEITEDNLHPNDHGHELMGYVVGTVFDDLDEEMKVYLASGAKDSDETEKLPAPLTKAGYTNSVRYQNKDESAVVLNQGFIPDLDEKKGITDCFKNGWIAEEPEDRIVFRIAGETFAAQYMKTINKPAPVVMAYVDGDYDNGVKLDANFDEDWGDKLYLQTLAEGLPYGIHTVEFELVKSAYEMQDFDDVDFDDVDFTEESGSPFVLVSVIASDSKGKENVNREILHLSPVITHNIWGGTRLRTDFGYEAEGDDLGECWGISAHPNGDDVIKNGKYKGMRLSKVFNEQPQLFDNEDGNDDRFPLLTKIIDAKDDLSIQVHPDDVYAAANENGSLGKMECWYVLDAPEGSALVAGHNAKTKDELVAMIHEGRWSEFIREIPVKKGDFIQIDPGTVHAIKGGILLLETQQNSDITYRVYDYDRLSNGKPRELHIEKSIDVITVPAKSAMDSVQHFANTKADEIVKMYTCKYYSVYKADIEEGLTVNAKKDLGAEYILLSVTDGDGYIDGNHVKKGDHMIIPKGYGDAVIAGNMQIILSTK